MQFDLTGDTAAFTVKDDPAEGTSVSGGGTGFTAVHNWAPCCTDGVAIGSLDGAAWSMLGQFTQTPGGINSWTALSSGSPDHNLVLAAGRRVRIDVVPAPGAALLALIGIGVSSRLRRRVSA